MLHARKDYMSIQDASGRIPEDEPVFLLRSTDVTAPKVVEYWAELAKAAGANEVIVNAALAQAQAMRHHQTRLGSKIPDMKKEDINIPEDNSHKIGIDMYNIFECIFKMQRELNIKIGRDTVDDPNKKDWLFQYAFATGTELHELINHTSPENAIVELIDMLHFIVSMCQIMDITSVNLLNHFFVPSESQYKSSGMSGWEHFTNAVVNFINMEEGTPVVLNGYNQGFSAALGYCLQQLQIIYKQVDWKWWSKSVKEDPTLQFKTILRLDLVCEAIKNLFLALIRMFMLFDVSPIQVLAIYQEKHKANTLRQENGYDVRTKTEADNEAIEHRIAQGNFTTAHNRHIRTGLAVTIGDCDSVTGKTNINGVNSSRFDPASGKFNLLEPKFSAIKSSSLGSVTQAASVEACDQPADERVEPGLEPTAEPVNPPTPLGMAWDTISQALLSDPGYAWAVQSNIAMNIFDTIGSNGSYEHQHQFSNVTAAYIIRMLFKVDVTPMFGDRFANNKVEWAEKYKGLSPVPIAVK